VLEPDCVLWYDTVVFKRRDTMGIKRGIIQARGLGDIVIALPIAKYYHDEGDEIYWPICEEFLSSFKDTAPWVNWIPIETDQRGLFFFGTPYQALTNIGVKKDDMLYLYQYLNSQPELTDGECYSILKFDQYKYWVSGVPFREKWSLHECITRDKDREMCLYEDKVVNSNYIVTHLKGSTFEVKVDVSWLDPTAQVINIDATTDNIFDWLSIIEGAKAVVCIDSVYANLIDQLGVTGPELYWIRRSPWDLTPVLGSAWTIIPTELSYKDVVRVDPTVEAEKKVVNKNGVGSSYSPYSATGASKMPTNFMYALKSPTPVVPTVPKLNSSLNLYEKLGVKI